MRNPDAIIAVYIMASRRNGTIYTGVTSDLHARVWKHKLGTFKGFTDDHGCKGLAWFEPHLGMAEAITREKQIKKWRREWKLALIEGANPVWEDLAADWYGWVFYPSSQGAQRAWDSGGGGVRALSCRPRAC